jgi:hypothetical protein
MRKAFGNIVLLLGVVSLWACGNVQNEYSTDYQCYFIYDTTIHNGGYLWAAVQPMNYGQFVFVYTKKMYMKSGNSVRYVYANLNGKTDSTAITTAKETNLTYALGAQNGLIIGRSLSGDNMLYAFDRQCPNCIDDYGAYIPLNWSNNGTTVYCRKCKRTYDLNNGGYPQDGGGKKLLRYRISYSGATIFVNN